MLIYRLRQDNHKPPPSYGLKSNLLTFCIHHSGEFIHIPDASYEGGSVFKFDYVSLSDMRISELLLLCEGVGLRNVSNFYFLINGGFKLLINDDELCHMFIDKLKFRQMDVYAEVFTNYKVKGKQLMSPELPEHLYLNNENLENDSEFHDTRVCETDIESNPDSIGVHSVRLEEFSDSDFDMNSEPESDEEYKLEKINHFDDELFDENVDADVVDLVDDLSSDGIVRSEGMRGGEMNTIERDNSNERDETTGDSESDPGEEDIIESGDDFGSAPDSDDEIIGPKFDVFNHADMYNPSFNFRWGMKFSSKKDLRKAITSHAVMNRRNVFIAVSDKKRLYARCRGKRCNWEVRARKVLGESTWQITEYPKEVHKCAKASRVRNMKSTWVAERYIDRFKSDPKRNIPGFVKDVALETKCNFSDKQGYRAKKLAMEMLEGDSGAQYSLLWDYRDEVLRSNPGSTVLVGSDEDGLFDRMYVCLGALKDGFLSGCRPILGVDGCHLWGPYKGVLLTAVGVDPNNNIYPLAWAVVTKENYDNWRWFLSAIRGDLGIERHDTWTFMSDKQKGLLLAFEEVFKDANNRFCVRHLHGNFKKAGFGGMAFKEALWKAARASTLNEYKRRMEEMKQIDPKAIEWFDEAN